MTATKLNDPLLAYPVGSIYMSVNSTSPATLFGGTWERIAGRFLLGATDGGSTGTNVLSTASAAAGASGGEAAHTLTKSEIANHGHGHTNPSVKTPKFTHTVTTGLGCGWNTSGGNGDKLTYGNVVAGRAPSQFFGVQEHAASSCTVSGGGVSDMTGGGGSHNTMPPFLAVYIWKRTA